ncbi:MULTISPECIES: WecB/TagA/CpsF family glycosyltransferase [unclassified Paenibacillus]|uniref:WecB/TagA/CpsF family glycosyltransferase n=1 Tax=unclassified Paenibacillus TaxID=185978 RepID=UPI0004F5906C|nr:WecB/TagA/CpsF family glycosyltransferase [Paenibacillus sp. FSL H7-0357]AIQ16103.1 N-acetylmannosaminyltransferase [Paenibacillus sp. FSL H7-0357]
MNDIVSILGVPFSKLTLEETTLRLAEQVQNKQDRLFHLITANPEITLASQTDELLQEIISSADLIVPDGIGIVLAARRKGEPIPERVTGYDLLLRMLEKGNELGWSFYFLGTDEITSRQAVEKINASYPQVKIAGRHHGFFNAAEEQGILADIQRSKPDVLILAMGAPYSDKWLYKHKQELTGVKLVFGVGGSLDVISGKVKPAPVIWKKLNLEWAHRLLFAPVAKGQKSRWRRQSALPKFVYRTMLRK